jgi:putative RNA 2'-phosphotransferase
MSKTHLAELSKFLSFVLRHQPEHIGLSLDREGWADIEALLLWVNHSGKALDLATLMQVIEESDKKRFSLSEDGLRIRAAQGHSTKVVSINHPEKTPPDVLYHGTATRLLDAILAEGLRAGSRHHVHLSDDMSTAHRAGQRYGSPVVLKVDAQQMHKQGFRFHQADNGVWLTAYAPASFISL